MFMIITRAYNLSHAHTIAHTHTRSSTHVPAHTHTDQPRYCNIVTLEKRYDRTIAVVDIQHCLFYSSF